MIGLSVSEGDHVTAGQKLVTLEAMKMEHSLEAPFDGVVEAVSVAMGDQVEDGALLIALMPASDAS